MIKCQKCGKFINTGPGENCPHCGSSKRLIFEKVEDKLNWLDNINGVIERINYKILFVGIFLALVTSLIGYFFYGVQGVLISFFVGVIIFVVAPHFREKRID